MTLIGDITLFAAVVAAAFTASALLTMRLRESAHRAGRLDPVKARSAHRVPVPRGGGLAVVLVTILGTALAAFFADDVRPLASAMTLAGGLVALVGWRDDCGGSLTVAYRLLAHLLAAAIGVVLLRAALPDATGIPMILMAGGLVLALGWFVNLFNFMDGIDGMAGGQAMVLAFGLAVLFHLASSGAILPALVLLGAAGGFLLHNRPPASIFLGDVGSGFLGIATALLALDAARAAPLLLPGFAVLTAVFVADATLTLAWRLASGASPADPHDRHAYQALARRTQSHGRVTLGYALVTLVYLLPLAAATVLALLPPAVALALAYGPLLIAMALVDRSSGRLVRLPEAGLAGLALSLPRRVKQTIVLAGDVVLALIAAFAAYSIRLDRWHWPQTVSEWSVYGLAGLLFVPFFIRFGLYRAIFRYSGIAGLRAIGSAVLCFGVLFFTLLLLARLPGVPRSLGIVQPLLFAGLVAASRLLAAQWLRGLQTGAAGGRRRTIILYGAGSAGAEAAQSLTLAGEARLAAFIDDDPERHGRRLNGVPIHGPDALDGLIADHRVTDVLLALGDADAGRRRAIVARLEPFNIRVRSIPAVSRLATGDAVLSEMEDLPSADLIDRPALAAPFDAAASGLARVMVTGAGGSIGSELARQLLAGGAARLILVDHSEFALYRIAAELEQRAARGARRTQIVAHLANVRDEPRMADLMTRTRPDAIYHAAAYKHVPLIENDPVEGVTNNVFGTLAVARLARRHGVARFVLVSTDKAVRPTNVMGATKRMAELIVQALAAEPAPAGRPATVFSMVRFGNVLESSGSVVPLFRAQIRAGGPVTVTDPRVTRYFMTIPEAVALVLHAGQMAKGGEVFVLDMGAPVKIVDLARRLIRLSGRTERTPDHPHGDIEIRTIGLRPGEKLYEELLIGDDPKRTAHPAIMMARERFLNWPELQPVLAHLREAAARNDAAACAAIQEAYVSGYTPWREPVVAAE